MNLLGNLQFSARVIVSVNFTENHMFHGGKLKTLEADYSGLKEREHVLSPESDLIQQGLSW